jgi:segregation and condensation protein B
MNDETEATENAEETQRASGSGSASADSPPAKALQAEPSPEEVESEKLPRILEALLFATELPLTLERLRAALPKVEPAAIREALEILRGEYDRDGRAFTLRRIEGGYQLASHPRYAEWIARLRRGKPRARLSRPALETLAIIAYRQPVTRAEVEAIRGVNADGVLRTLLERHLVTVTGRREAPGRPLVFGTTRDFLAYFGLNDLRDLPEEGELEGLLEGDGIRSTTGDPAEQVPGPDGD